METIWAAILGAIQGATEFLPVSSSGHLAVGQMVIAEVGPDVSFVDRPLTLEILLHLATLLSVIVVFRRDLRNAVMGAGRAVKGAFHGRFRSVIKTDEGANLAFAVLLGSVPTAVLGFLLRDVAQFCSKTPIALGASFLFCAILLLASKWWKGGQRKLSWKWALIIGVVQGIAVLPGISRSGITIAVGLALGLGRKEAAKFSFLLSLPAILGAALLELEPAALAADHRIVSYSMGAIAAFAVGLVALYALMRIVEVGRLWLFAPYVGAVGICTLVWF